MNQEELVALAQGSSAPRWEVQEPGRIAWELAWLSYFGAKYVVLEEYLKDRIFALEIEWPRPDDSTVNLKAIFPDTYPRTRPVVNLLDKREEHRPHISPVDGNVCLLGRDSRQWTPDLGLGQLLDSQLEDALQNTGDIDPQGEPDEFWWNYLSLEGSYILIDSRWDLSGHQHGKLKISFAESETATFTGYVSEVLDGDGTVIASWQGNSPLGARATERSIVFPWGRVDKAVFPAPDRDDLSNAIRSHPHLELSRQPTAIKKGAVGRGVCLIYPMDSGVGETEDGWLFVVQIGKAKDFFQRGKRGHVPREPSGNTIATFRAGEADIGSRVPSHEILSSVSMAVIGTGALGAPLAIDLAKNGGKVLGLLDHDIVEPGNSIRWPLGATVYGKKKVLALRNFIANEYPRCDVTSLDFRIGSIETGNGRDEAALASLERYEILFDASASFSVSTVAHDLAREHKKPLISLWATPDVQGGAVVYYAPGGACPTCIENYHHSGAIDPPPGTNNDDLIQPVGCAERTFRGASFELGEISLHAARVAAMVAEKFPESSIIWTMQFEKDSFEISAPSWSSQAIKIHPDCSCPH